jgi:hypothetical protein
LETRWDWEKFDYWYRVWGRLTYNPEATTDTASERAATSATSCLTRASRILPIVTTAHMPSAACDAYWPEIYWNQPMVGEPRPNPYGDTPAPKTFLHVSPLDPQLFSSIAEHASELLKQERSGKYSPIEVAQWLDALAAGVDQDLARLDRSTPSSSSASPSQSQSPSTRRIVIDARIQAGLGRFFAAKFRAGVLYALHEQTGDRRALEAALTHYREARRAWAELSEQARTVYAADLSVSDKLSERGHWVDRLPAIDADIDQMAQRLTSSSTSASPSIADAQHVQTAITQLLTVQHRPPAPCRHTPPAGFHAGAPLTIELTITGGRTAAAGAVAVDCHYRHVNQAERFQTVRMDARGRTLNTTIPATYTDSPYPLQYYFTVKSSPSNATLFPGLGSDLVSQPYFVLRRL